MEFEILTLVDVTESGSHRGPDKLAVSQQANYNSLIQVIGLRVNPIPKRIKVSEENIDELGFGTKFKGKQRYWTFVFEIDYGATSIEELTEDFHLVPFIQDLTNTVDFDKSVFNAIDKEHKNILFKKVD